MSVSMLLNRFFGITNKKVDYFAVIFAAVILAGGKKIDDEMRQTVEADAKKLFKSRAHQDIFASQVNYFYSGGMKGNKDLNYMVKLINRNAKLYKSYNPRIPYYLLKKYRNDAIEQTRLFEFLNTIKADIDTTPDQAV